MRTYLRLLVIFVIFMLVSCGGGSSNSQGMQGLWMGSYSVNSTVDPLVGAIVTGGDAVLLDSSGNVYMLTPSISASGPYTGYLITYPRTQNSSTLGTIEGGKLPVSGTVTTSNIQLSANQIDRPAGTLALNPYEAYTGTPTFTAGLWQGYYLGTSSTLSLSLDSGGSISGTDASGCDVTGNIGQVVANQNLYKVSYTTSAVTGSASGSCGESLSGLGFVSSHDMSGKFGSGTFFYMVLTANTEAYALEFKMP